MYKFSKLSPYKNIILEIVLVLIIGLVPLLWFGLGNDIVIGHDAGYPLEPVSWTENRIYSWNESVNWGNDNSMTLGTLFVHAPEYLLAKLGVDDVLAQRIVFIFWASLMILSMYALTLYITRYDKKYRVFRLTSSILYLINFFVLQAWFIVERTKFSMLIAIPLVLLFLFRAVKKKNWLLNSVLAALCLTIFNGGGSAFTLYGGFFLILIVLALSLTWFFKFNIKKVISIFLVFGITFVIFNSYWIIPQIYFSLNNYGNALNEFGGLEATINWAKEISQNSSIENVMRLQGIPDWYGKDYHPYAINLLSSNFFKVISSLLPLLAFLPLYIYRNDKNFKAFSRFLGLLAIVAILFTTGMHMPFGLIYEQLLRHIPFFTTYRTPFYKFGYALWFAYSLLIGLTLNYLSNSNLLKIEFIYRVKHGFSKVTLPWRSVTLILSILTLVSYTLPYFSSNIFKWHENYSTLLNPPNYIYEYREWAKNTSLEGTTLILPKLDETNLVDKYEWGYYSIQPLPSILGDKPILTNSLNLSSSEEEKIILESIYLSLEKDPALFERLSELFKIDSILFRRDVSEYDSNLYSLENISSTLEGLDLFEKKHEWGKWELYTRKDSVQQITATSEIENIKADSELSYQLIKKIAQNIESDIFSINNEGIQSNIKILGTENLVGISPQNNSFTYATNKENFQELQIRRQPVENSSYILYARKLPEGYELKLKEPDIRIEAGNEAEVIIGDEHKFSYKGDLLKYITLNDAIFDISKVVDANYIKIGKYYAINDPEIEVFFYEKNPSPKLSEEESDNYDWPSHLADCGGTTNQIDASRWSGGNDPYFSVEADNARACILFELNDIQPESIIELSLNIQKKLGSSPHICLLEKSDQGSECIFDEKYYGVGSSWSNFTEVTRSNKDTDGMILHLYAESASTKTIVNYKDIIINEYLPKSSITVNLNEVFTDKELIMLPINTNLGNLNISSEDAPLSINSKPYIQNASFEENDFPSNNICGEYKDEVADVILSQKHNSTAGRYSLNIEASAGAGCYREEIKNFEGSKLYYFSLDYKHISGDNGRVCLLQLGAEDVCLPEIELLDNIDWQTYAMFFEPTAFSERAVVHLYSDAKNYLTSNLYDNLIIKSVDNPLSFIALKNNSDYSGSDSLIRITKDTPAIKFIELPAEKSNSSIILNQAYSKDWLLVEVRPNENFGSNIAMILKHLLGNQNGAQSSQRVNFIFNSWNLENVNSNNVILIYKPQIIYLLSLFASIFSISILAIGLYIRILSFNFKRNKKTTKRKIQVQKIPPKKYSENKKKSYRKPREELKSILKTAEKIQEP